MGVVGKAEIPGFEGRSNTRVGHLGGAEGEVGRVSAERGERSGAMTIIAMTDLLSITFAKVGQERYKVEPSRVMVNSLDNTPPLFSRSSDSSTSSTSSLAIACTFSL